MFSLTTNHLQTNTLSPLNSNGTFLNVTYLNVQNGGDQSNVTAVLPGIIEDDYPNRFANVSLKNTTTTIDISDNYTEYAEIPYYIKATSMTFCIAIMCLGVIGNVMVPIVILKTKDMRNSTNIFLVNLSIADLMVLLVCTPTVLVEVNSKPETWVLGKELCLAVPFVELTVAHASVLTILAISFERYYAICEPLRAGYVCTKTRATLICALAWFFAALFTSPILAIAEHRTIENQNGGYNAQCLTQAVTFWQIFFFIVVIILLYIIPLIILIILYSIIAKNLISAAAKVVMNKTVDPYNIRARKQVILMLGTVVLCFFLCLMPYRMLALYIIVTPTEFFENMNPEKWYNLLYFSRIMLYINSAINPILYNLMSSKFRIGFCKVCFCYQSHSENDQGSRTHRKRAGTMTNASTTSSSISRTTNSLKKLFNRTSLDRSSHKCDADTEATNDNSKTEDANKRNSFLHRFVKRNYLRQQSEPANSVANKIRVNRMKSEGHVFEVANADRKDDSEPCDSEIQRFLTHSEFKSVHENVDLHSHNANNRSLRRNALINSATKNLACDKNDVVESVIAYKTNEDYEIPESFV